MKNYQLIKKASEYTGLSQYYIRNGCKGSSIPSIQSVEKNNINIEANIAFIDEEKKDEQTSLS